MALATQCPHCHTTFRVAADQLKLRGGIVRCGACQRIFDGNAHLIDLAQPAPAKAAAADTDAPPVYTLDFDHTFDPLGILPKVETEAQAGAMPPAPVAETAPPAAQDLPPEGGAEADAEADADAQADADAEADAQADAETDADDELDAEAETEAIVAGPVETEPAALAPPASADLPLARVEPGFELPVDEELVAQPLPSDQSGDHDEAPAASAAVPGGDDIPLPLRASAAGDDSLTPPATLSTPRSARARAVEARTRRSRLTPTRIDAPKLRVPALAEVDEPDFVKRSRKQEQAGRTRRLLTMAGAMLLGMLLAVQLLANFRNLLAARYPAARPVLAAGCSLLGCRIGLPMQIENLAIETGELSTLGVGTYSLSTLLRNQGQLVQAWPSIQLELTDANDRPLLRRVFGPAEYLPRGVSAAAGFGARSEQPVRLNFALTGLTPSGYHMIVFYP